MNDVKLTPTRIIAGLIQHRDGDNRLSAHDLGAAIADWLAETVDFRRGTELVAFVERTNPRKDVGAGALAERIVAQFELDGEVS